MSKLQRWNIYFDCITRKPPEVVKDSLGPWVSFEDAKKLEEENERLKKKNEELLTHLLDLGGCVDPSSFP